LDVERKVIMTRRILWVAELISSGVCTSSCEPPANVTSLRYCDLDG
jgi:hypothetical protein